jgi:hypothetical protein
MSGQQLLDLVKMIWPVIALNYIIVIWALIDLVRRENVKYISKLLWGVIIVFVNLIGPIAYLAFGRGE